MLTRLEKLMIMAFDYKPVCSLFVLWPDVSNSCCHPCKRMDAQTARRNPTCSTPLSPSLGFTLVTLSWAQSSVTQRESPSSTIVMKCLTMWAAPGARHHLPRTEWGPKPGPQAAHSPPGPVHSPAHMRRWWWQCSEGFSYFWDLTVGLSFPLAT